jgi:hypothetical protein
VELKLETGAGRLPLPLPLLQMRRPMLPPKRRQKAEATMVIPRGVSLSDLEGGGRPPGFDTSKEFSKKRNRAGIYFWMNCCAVVKSNA